MGCKAPIALVALVWCLSSCYAYPAIYVARYADKCTDHPSANFGKVHDFTSTPDKTVVFTLYSAATGKAVTPLNSVSQICAGEKYNLKFAFGAPSERNYLLTSSHGSFVAQTNDCDAWCPNRVCSAAPTRSGSALFSLPCGTAGGTKVTVKITSSNGRIPTPGSALRSATLSLVVNGKCSNCGTTTTTKPPATIEEKSKLGF